MHMKIKHMYGSFSSRRPEQDNATVCAQNIDESGMLGEVVYGCNTQ